jgi:hypothetical protein
MTARRRIAEWLWPRDARAAAEIEAEVREELAGHLDRLAEDECRAGADADEARRLAAARFGDLDAYAAECRRIDLGDRLLVRRALAAACLALLCTCGYLGWRLWQSEQTATRLQAELASRPAGAPSNASTAAPSDAEAWVARLAGLRDHMHTAFSVGPELTLLPPDEGLAVVRAAWPDIQRTEVKTGLLKAFQFSKALAPAKHPHVLKVLHLGMTDADREVSRYAAAYLEEYAGENFDGDSARYDQWYRRHRDLPIDRLQSRAHATSPRTPDESLAQSPTRPANQESKQ